MRRLAARFIPLTAVVAVLAAIYGISSFTRPAAGAQPASAAPAIPRSAAITSATRACPPVAAKPGQSGNIAMIAVAGAAGTGTSGTAGSPASEAALAPLTTGSSSAQAAPLLRRSQAGLPSLTAVTGAVEVDASGSMARGLEAEESATGGAAEIRCSGPGSDIWFAGPGQQSGAADVQLYLMNTDSSSATVDVNVITDAGVVAGTANKGITVPPHGMVMESLSQYASGSSTVAFNVQTSRGRVAAAVWEASAAGTRGSWLPPAATPATSVVIPGIPAGSGSVRVFLVVPGAASARVKVVALTPQGSLEPIGAQPVQAVPESATSFALTSVGSTSSAVELKASEPVTAAVEVTGGGATNFSAATEALQEQGVVAGNLSGAGATSAVELTAPGSAASARVTVTSPAAGGSAAGGGTASGGTASGGSAAGGTASGGSASGGTASGGSAVSASQVVAIPAAHTVATVLRPPAGARPGTPFAVTVTPIAGSGPVYAARVLSRNGTAESIIGLESALTRVGLPAVRESYSAILPLPADAGLASASLASAGFASARFATAYSSIP